MGIPGKEVPAFQLDLITIKKGIRMLLAFVSPMDLIPFSFVCRIYFGEVQLSGLGEGMIKQHTQTRAGLVSILDSHFFLFPSTRKTKSGV